MSAIQQIDTTSVHKLTSGQVIVDIPTAVKELVENSLDAHATVIEIKFKQYGTELFEVIDNGDGIDQVDFESIALKHHTSKLRTFADLESVATFGFRGEALNSLCAVASSVLITTCTAATAPLATKLEYDFNGQLTGRTTLAGTVGTSVMVTKLFDGKLPVRRSELLKNAKREFAKCVTMLQAYGVIKTNVKIVLSNITASGKKTVLFATNGNSSIKDNIMNVFGAKATLDILSFSLTLEIPRQRSQTLASLETKDQTIAISGFISKPDPGLGRNTSDRQLVYINGRPCDMPSANKLFNECYKTFNPTQYPFLVADFQVPYESADVNVSPDKRTILLHNEQSIFQALKDSLTTFLESCDHSMPTQSIIQSSDSLLHMQEIVTPKSTFDSTNQEEISVPTSTFYVEDSGSITSSASRRFASKITNLSSSSPVLSGSITPNRQSNSRSTILSYTRDSRPSKRSRTNSISSRSPTVERSIRNRLSGITTLRSQSLDSLEEIGQDHSNTDDELELSDSISEAAESSHISGHPAHSVSEGVISPPTGDKIGIDVTSDLPERSSIGERMAEIEDYSPSKSFRKKTKSKVDIWQRIEDKDRRHYTHSLSMSINLALQDISQLQSATTNVRDSIVSSGKDEIFESEIEEGEEYMQSLNISKSDFQKMNIVGQFNLGFIIATRCDKRITASQVSAEHNRCDLFIIDQHASDEKFNFERLQREVIIMRQPLVVPLKLSLTPLEELVVSSNLPVFTDNGFTVYIDDHAAPGEKCSLTAVPVVMSTAFGLDDFSELLYAIREAPGTAVRCTKLRKMLAMKACRSSVMIGTGLSHDKMRTIVDSLGTLDKPWNCPHGRPTMRHLADISKLSSWDGDMIF
ncbi:hypothetical protein V1512DRAFT_259811 [Lipomyces arxii]|uniref:uncharacterized protein n=1 Tax=Lipomyces arxii TaxID=56418 RepID=UPI0034D0197A